MAANPMTAPRRRWFRFAFSLRTLFVVVTACALWLGWQVRIVQERKAVLAEFQCRGKGFFDNGYVPLERVANPSPDDTRIPLVRRLLGDESCFEMHLPRSIGRKWIACAELAFPEAKLRVFKDEDHFVSCAFRDSLYAPDRRPNLGTLFKTGIPDPNAADQDSP